MIDLEPATPLRIVILMKSALITAVFPDYNADEMAIAHLTPFVLITNVNLVSVEHLETVHPTTNV